MKTVLFGGGFDPPHRGHERALKALLERLSPDRVVILPSGVPPHKALSGGADAFGRMDMCRAAFGGVPGVVFSDFDLRQEGKCFSYNALEHFKKDDPNGKFFLFVGTDQLLEFETWYRFEDLLKGATLVTMSRYENDSALWEKKARLERDYGAEILLLDEEAIVISSTEVRIEIAHRGFSEYLSPGVNEIITRRGFYGSRLNERRGAVLDHIFSVLDEERLTHTLGMERETVRIAELVGYPTEEIRLAALLHDLTRRWPDEKQIGFLREAGEKISAADAASPVVLHGRSAAIIADKEFGLDTVFCDAIRYHTTGRARMTLPDKILFFADYIEDTRRHDVCVEARSRFYTSLPEGKENRLRWLDECILASLDGTASHLKERALPVHPLTLMARDSLARAMDDKRKETL